MKKTMITMLMVGIAAFVFTANAYATIPTIDGIVNPGEWDNEYLHTLGGDPDEALIPDGRDIESFIAKHVNNGGVQDGFYLLVDTYANPDLSGGPNSVVGSSDLRISINLDGVGGADLFLNFNGGQNPGEQKLGVYTSPAFTAVSFVGFAEGSVVQGPNGAFEFFLAENFWEDLGYTNVNDTRFQVSYDDNGSNPDDFLPDNGFTNPVPEPATFALVGMGLLSSLGFGFRRSKS